jgi:signal transduction histidine kinase
MIDSTGGVGAGARAASDSAERLREHQRQAARIQHEIKNPLAALLAEAQLLAQAPLPAEHAIAVERIVELTRRVVRKVEALDVLRGDEAPE